MTTPDASETWLDPIFDAVISDIQRTGFFDRVQGHEPDSKPGNGLTAAVWVITVDPLRGIAGSGLASTSARVAFNVRLYTSRLMEPKDIIDPRLMRAASSIMREYHDDFDFGLTDLVRNVDLLGAFGVPLSLITGYLEQDGTIFRIADITVPVICNDVWPQVT
jgi:hypothetical protein